MNENNKIKLKFILEKDKDGYPPAEIESVWAKDLGGGKYEIENSLFYARGISWKDIVTAESRDGELWYKEKLIPSHHSTIRIYFYKECPPDEKEEAMRFLNNNGATYEGFAKDYLLYTVDLPPEADYQKIMTYLRKGEVDNFWGVEESSYRHKI